MHQSIFTYGLSKPYPYRWFTWAVVIGGIIATALFSVVSVAANGYDTALRTVANPNKTENPSSPQWFQKQPWSLASKVSPKCQDQVFTVGSDLYATPLGFRHLLRSTYRLNASATEPRRSIAYHNSALENCAVWRATVAAWPGGFNVSFVSVCGIYENHVPISLELYTYFDASNKDEITYDYTLWPSWYMWQDGLTRAELNTCLQQLTELSNGSMWSARSDYFFPRPGKVMSSAIATYGNRSLRGRIGGEWLLDVDPGSWPAGGISNISNISVIDWINTPGLDALPFFDTFMEDENVYSQPWNVSSPAVSLLLRADNIVRILYSALLSDFGQIDSRNLFTSPQAFFDYVDAVDTMNRKMGDDTLMPVLNALAHDDPTSPVFEFNETTRQNISSLFAWSNASAPKVEPSFLNTLYLCEVPKMKPVLSLIFVVVVADLVFLQALYVGFGFVVKLFLDSRVETANYCSGCSAAMRLERVDCSIRADTQLLTNTSDAIAHEKSIVSTSREIVDDDTLRARKRSSERLSHLGGENTDESTTLL